MSSPSVPPHDTVLTAIDELSLQIAEVKSQIQEIERDCSLMSASLEKTKGSLASIGSALDGIRVNAAAQFAELSASKTAEDELRDAVTSSFSDMFQAITKVVSTAQKLGLAAGPYTAASCVPEPSAETVEELEPQTPPGPELAEEISVETPELPPAETVEELEPQTPPGPELAEEISVETPELPPAETVEEPEPQTPPGPELAEEIPVETSAPPPAETVEEPEPQTTTAEEPVEIPAFAELADAQEWEIGGEEETTPMPELPPLPQITAVEELPSEPDDFPGNTNFSDDVDEEDGDDEEDEDEYEDIEGDPEAVADLLKNFSSSFSTELPELPQTDELDAAAADLEKLLDGTDDGKSEEPGEAEA